MLETSQNLVRLFDKSLEGLIDTIDVGLLLASKEIGQQLDRGESKSKPINNLLALLDKRIESVAHFRASNEHGHLIYGNTVETHPVNISDREYFIKLKNDPNAGLVITKPLMGRAAKEWVWGFVRRINKPDGSFGGVVLAAVSVDEVRQIFGQLKLGPYGIMALRDSGFSLVSDYPKGMHKIGMTKLHKPFAKAYAATPCIGSYVKGKDGIDGVERTFSYRCSKKYGYNVNVGVSHEAMLAGWKKGVWITVSLIAALTLASIWFLVLVTRAWRKQEKSFATLKESEEKLEEVARQSRTIVWEVNAEGFYTYISDVVQDVLGYSPEELVGKKHYYDLHPEEGSDDSTRTASEMFARKKRLIEFPSQVISKSGSLVWLATTGSPLLDEKGALIGYRGSDREITESKHKEEEIRKSHQRLEQLTLQLISTQEDERKHLARELHDELGQRFTTINLHLHRLKDHVNSPEGEQARKFVHDEITSLTDQIRTISGSLRPPNLDYFGLETSLNDLLEQQFDGTHVDYVLDYAGLPGKLPEQLEITIYRIIQEAITNITRHANASRVVIEANGGETNSEIEIVIRDNGIGFDTNIIHSPERSPNSFGLIGMIERVHLLHGEIDISSEPGAGTLIQVLIPMSTKT